MSISLSAASVIITATIAVPASHSASDVNAALSSSLRTAAAASAALGIPIVSAPTVVTTPPSSPPLDPPAPPAPGVGDGMDGGGKSGGGMGGPPPSPMHGGGMGGGGMYGPEASPPPTPCADDDAKLMSESQNRITSCAAGFATHDHVCSDDMFVDAGAAVGWFKATCPVTCGTCQDDQDDSHDSQDGSYDSQDDSYDSQDDSDDSQDGSYDSQDDSHPCFALCYPAGCSSLEDMARPECADCCQCMSGGIPCAAGNCGDGVCDPLGGETYGLWASCYVDCHCTDGWCDPTPPANETSANCPADCASASCGNGVCEPEANETAATCYEDCHCGDGFCDRRLDLGVGLGAGLGVWLGLGLGLRLGLGLGLGLELGLGLGLGPGWLS